MKKIVLTSLALSALLFAESTPLKTHTELSYINTTGNSNTESFALDFTAKKSFDAHKLRLTSDAIYSKADVTDANNTTKSVINKSKWSITGNYDYSFNSYLAINYLINNQSDKFSGYDNRFNTGPGVVLKPYTSKVQSVSLQTNILYSRDDFAKPAPSPKEYTSLASIFEYNAQLLSNLKFIQIASYKTDVDDTQAYFVTSKTAIENKINDIFSLGVSYKVDYVNQKIAKYYSDNTLLISLIIDY